MIDPISIVVVALEDDDAREADVVADIMERGGLNQPSPADSFDIATRSHVFYERLASALERAIDALLHVAASAARSTRAPRRP